MCPDFTELKWLTVALDPFQIFQLSSLMGDTRLLQKEIHLQVWKEQVEVSSQSNVGLSSPYICIVGPFVR